MQPLVGLPRLCLALGTFAVLSGPEGVIHKLNGPLPIRTGASVKAFLITPDDQRVAYLAGLPGGEILFSAPTDGSQASIDLAVTTHSSVTYRMKLSPDGEWVVYVGDADQAGVRELHSVPIDGSSPALVLSGALVAGGEVRTPQNLGLQGMGPWFSPDSTHVVYAADALTNDVVELFSVPIDASAPPVRISGPMVVGGDVWPEGDSSGAYTRVLISPDSQWVFYLADQDTNDVRELYRAPLDGSSPPIRLNDALVAGESILNDFELDPAGTRVVFRMFHPGGIVELYSVPSDGSQPPVELNASLVSGGNVIEAHVSSDGIHVAYYADQDVNDIGHFYSVPIDGSLPPVRLSGPYVSGGGSLFGPQPTPHFALSPAGDRVVYCTDEDGVGALSVYSVPIDGSAASTLLNGGLLPGRFVGWFKISPDAARVVYAGNLDVQGVGEIASAPITGGGEVELNAPLAPDEDVWFDFSISPTGAHVFFEIRTSLPSSSPPRFWSVPTDGSAGPTALPDGILARRFTADGSRLLYLKTTDGVTDLYSVPIDASEPPQRLNALIGLTFGEIASHQHSPDGRQVVYIAEQDTLDALELFSVPADGLAAPRKLNGPLVLGGVVQEARVRPDSLQVAYRADQDEAGLVELYAAAFDGPSTPFKLSGPLQPTGDVFGFEYTQDSARVVYRADEGIDGTTHVFSVPSDGSQPRVLLSGNVVPGGDVLVARPTPDSARVVFLADRVVDGRIELFSAPVDGSGAPVDLSGGLVSGGNVIGFQIASDSARATFLADKDAVGRFEMYSSPVDGSAAPVKLSGTLVPGGDVTDGLVSPDGAQAVFLSDHDVDGVFELFSVPIDGAMPAVQLNHTLAPGADVTEIRVSRDSARVLYLTASFSPEGQVFELFSVPTTGGAPVLLSGVVEAPGVSRPRFSSDSARVVYLVVTDGRRELFSVPSDGSAAPVKLNGNLVAGGGLATVAPFQIHPDGKSVVYLADQEQDERFELYQVAIDGSAVPVKRNGALAQDPVGNGVARVAAYSIDPGGRTLVYRAWQDTFGADELYSVVPPRSIRRAPP